MTYTETKYASVVEMAREECCDCGIVFWAPKEWQRNKRQTQARFYCPNGHPQSYTISDAERARQEAKRLADQLASVRAMNDQLSATAMAIKNERDHLGRRLRAQQGATKRIKRRVGKGTCPCCGVGFPNLREHMAENHPEFKHDLAIGAPKS